MGNGGRNLPCPGCKAENPEDSRFCRRCGAPLPHAHETLPYPTPTPFSPAGAGSASGPRFAAGAAFGERYRIIEEVGSGGMGRVYKAEDTELDTIVALKMIRPELAADPGVIERFKTEVRLARSISHDNVVRIHDLGEVGGIKYVSMDFIKGEDLKSIIRLSGALSVDTALKIAVQAGEALRAAHRKNIIHQDLKPQNIMVEADGRVFVTDFGLAALLPSGGGAGAPPGAVGTPLYFSPEQARGAPADPRSDVYSFGVVLYEMLAGREPFRAATAAELARKHESEHPVAPSRLNPAVPAALDKIVLKCLAKRREDRFQTFDDLLDELRRLAPSSRYGPRRALWRPLLPWLPAALFVLAAAIAGLRLFGPRDEQRPGEPSLRSPLKRLSIAVLEAINHTGDPALDHLSGEIEDLLSTDLGQSRYLGVLSSDLVSRVRRSMGQTEKSRHSTEFLDRIAQDAGVEYFILPSFARAGDRFRISVKVLKAGASELMDTAQAEGDNVFWVVDALTPKLKSILRLTQSEIAADYDRGLGQITTTSIDALREYTEGRRLYLEKRFEDSNRALSRAVAADPDFALAYKKMADNYSYLGDVAQARGQIGKALALIDHVSERERYLIQGYASVLLDESPAPAIASYQMLLEHFPNDEEGLILLGSVFRNLERWAEAEHEFQKLLDINPRSELAAENLAYINAGMGRTERAIGIVLPLRALFPRSVLLNRRLALLLTIQGRFEEARRELDRILRDDATNVDARELDADILQLMDEINAARSAYGRLAESPDAATSSRGRSGLVQLALLRGGFGSARSACRLGRDLALKAGRNVDIINAELALARISLGLGRWAEASTAARAASETAAKISYNIENKQALMLYGMALAEAGRALEAEPVAESLSQLIARTGCPAHERYLNALRATLALTSGRPTQAVEFQEKAMALLPGQIDKDDDHAFFYFELGRILEAAGMSDQALKAYEKLASLTSARLRSGDRYARSLYRIGILSETRGDATRASSAYRRFLSYWDDADPGLPEPADARLRLKRLEDASRPRTVPGPP